MVTIVMDNKENIGAYRLEERIGYGGMAQVYRAVDERTRRDVAIKIINTEIADDPTFRKRFEQETTLIATLEHSAIVPLYDVGETEGRPYLVMRYMPNGTLAERIQDKPFSLEETSRLVQRLAPALDFAHRRGIVHRDLKPANILLDQHDEAYIADFGIAKITEAGAGTLSRTGQTIGTPAYMSPEQFRGDTTLDGRADIYALGVMVYQMLAGQLPYDANTPHGMLYQHLESPIPDIRELRPDLSEDMHLLLQQALAKRREDRYPTATIFAQDLQAVTDGRAITPLPSSVSAHLKTVPLDTRAPRADAPPPTTMVASAPTASSNRMGAILLGVGALVLLIGFFVVRGIWVAGDGNDTPTGTGGTTNATATAAIVVAADPTESPTEAAPTETTVESTATTTPTVSVTASPAISLSSTQDPPPTKPVADYVIYDDNLQNGFQNWSWATTDLFNRSPVYANTNSVLVDYGANYAGVWFMNIEEGVDTTNYSALRFAIHGGTRGGQILLVTAGTTDVFPEENRIDITQYLPSGPVAQTWREVTIPLADLNVEGVILTNVGFQSDVPETQARFYLDDIRLISE